MRVEPDVARPTGNTMVAGPLIDRDGDQAGLTAWYGHLLRGGTLAQISDAFAASAEFQQRYGALTDRQFVELVYRNVLERDPDADGLAFWLGRLDSGLKRGDLMLGFSESIEFILRTDSLPPR